jgi:hypothetical protein
MGMINKDKEGCREAQLALWAPGWPMFTVANVFSLFLTPPRTWKEWARSAGFKICDEGSINAAWWVLLEKE